MEADPASGDGNVQHAFASVHMSSLKAGSIRRANEPADQGGPLVVLRRRALVRGAMVGGAAYYAGRRISQGEQREYEQQQRLESLEAQQTYHAQQEARYTPPPSAPQASVVAQLTDLKKLLDAGVLTQTEFDSQKSRILQG